MKKPIDVGQIMGLVGIMESPTLPHEYLYEANGASMTEGPL